jgi:hypothetical protein
MIKIDEKIIKSLKKSGANVIIKTISASGGCCDMGVKDVCIEPSKNFSGSSYYNEYYYDGIKIFIEKFLELEDEIYIYEKAKLPLIGQIYGVKGVSVKYL